MKKANPSGGRKGRGNGRERKEGGGAEEERVRRGMRARQGDGADGER